MPVRIRLTRVGKKHVPFYRLVAVDGRRKRDGASLDFIGTYDALSGKIITFKPELYQEWIAKGAIPSDSAKKIYREFKRSAQDMPSIEPQVVTKTAQPE